MCQIVFWNQNRKDLTDLVCELASSTNADILVLNECTVPFSETLQALKSRVDDHFFVPKTISEDNRFHCFCRNSALDLTEVHKGNRTSVRNFKLASTQVLLVLVHGVDIRNYDSENRQAFLQNLMVDLQLVKKERHNRLILIGDFNMNPYERGMNQAMGLNAMMTRTCVTPGQRTSMGKEYDLYYNPMWSLFGDGSEGPAGTFYDRSNQGPYGWSMLDQVVFSHSIVNEFENVRIMTHAGDISLTDEKGHPNSKTASDHLPIAVKLKGINYE